jgi:hypothetical protein
MYIEPYQSDATRAAMAAELEMLQLTRLRQLRRWQEARLSKAEGRSSTSLRVSLRRHEKA